MLTPRHLAGLVAVAVLVLIGWHFLAFCLVAGFATGTIARARRGTCPADTDQPAERTGVDLDKAIATVERIARLGASTARRGRSGRR